MKLWKTLFVLSALATTGCSPASDRPASVTSSALALLDVPIGQTHAQFGGMATEGAFVGSVLIGAPLVSGELSDTFYDYSVQLDASTKKVVAVSARRVFVSMPECQKHFATIVSTVKVKHRFDSEHSVGPASLEATSGPLGIEVLCGFVSGANHPTLSLSIVNKSLAAEAYRNAQHHDGR